MTGSVPPGLLAVPVETDAYDGVEYGDETAETDNSDVKARLEDLGYL